MKISHVLSNGKKLAFIVFIAVMASCSLNGNPDTNSAATGYQYDAQGNILHPNGALADDALILQNSSNNLSVNLNRIGGITVIPSSLDLSSRFPPVGDQGIQGSCVGWAVAYAMKTYLEKLEEGWPVTYSKYQFSPSWLYNQIKEPEPTNGASIAKALDFIIAKGCDTLAEFPYDQYNYSKKPNTASLMRAVKYRSRSWAYAGYYKTKGGSGRYWSPDVIKMLLASGAPVVIRVLDYPDLDKLNSSNPIYDTIFSTNRGGHALCLVGYDDSKQAFKFINSWGTSWGLNGYGWLSYNLINEDALEFYAYTMVDSPNMASEVYVSSTGNDANPGTVMKPVLSIQRAINMAVSKNITNVMVASGTYHERIEIPNRSSYTPFSLLGGWDNNFVSRNGYSILDAGGTSGNNALLCMVNVHAGTYLDRFIFQNNTNSSYVGYMPAADFKARSCGIYLSNVVSTAFSNCIIRNNYVGGGYVTLSSAIYMDASDDIDFVNITISNNSGFSAPVFITGNSLYSSLTGTINNNTAKLASGIEVNNCAFNKINAVIRNNTSGYGHGALKLYGGSSITVEGSIYSNTGGGLLLQTNTNRYYNIIYTKCNTYGNTPFDTTNIISF